MLIPNALEFHLFTAYFFNLCVTKHRNSTSISTFCALILKKYPHTKQIKPKSVGYRSLILLFVCLTLNQSYAQEGPRIEKVGATKYQYNHSVKRLHKFDVELTLNDLTRTEFNQFNNARKGQRVVNIVGTSLLIGTFSLASAAYNENENGALGAAIISVLGGAASGATLLIGNLAFGSQKAKHKRRLINAINLGSLAGMTDQNIQSEKNALLFPHKIIQQQDEKIWSVGDRTDKFHLLGTELMKDDFTNAEFTNFQTFRRRTTRSLKVSYIVGGAIIASEILTAAGVVNEDTARGSSYRFLTRTLPVISLLGSLGFAAKFNLQQTKSRNKLIEYVNGYAAVPEETSINYWAAGVTDQGLSIRYHF